MVLYLSVADASRILDVTPQTVRLMIRRGILPVTARTVGGIQLFQRADVEQLAAARRARHRPTAKGEHAEDLAEVEDADAYKP